jgi:hypothetical protein
VAIPSERALKSLFEAGLTNFLYLCSCVTYQDQSKRKETRMTLFYVCTNIQCGHTFQDPAVANTGVGVSMDTSSWSIKYSHYRNMSSLISYITNSLCKPSLLTDWRQSLSLKTIMGNQKGARGWRLSYLSQYGITRSRRAPNLIVHRQPNEQVFSRMFHKLLYYTIARSSGRSWPNKKSLIVNFISSWMSKESIELCTSQLHFATAPRTKSRTKRLGRVLQKWWLYHL